MTDWKNKLLACVHDPPSSPFRCALPFGVLRSRDPAETILKVASQSLMRRYGTSADVWTPARRGKSCERQLRDNTRIVRDSPLTR
jgi:hypothetical protein